MADQVPLALSWLEQEDRPLSAVAAAALLLITAWSVGRLLIRLPVAERGSVSLIAVATGLPIVGWLAVVLGSAGLLANGRTAWMLVALAVGSALVRAALLRRHEPAAASANAGEISTRRRHRWVWLALALPLLFTLGPALVLPDGWDELVYHVELPRRWLESGIPSVDPDLPYSAFPSLPELLFWLVAPINLPSSPRLINWTTWVLAIAVLNRICRRSLPVWPAGVVTLAFALSPAVLMVSANCYVEAFLLLELAALISIATSSAQSAEVFWRRIAVIGVLCGGAASVKLTGLVALLFPFLDAWARPQSVSRRAKAAWMSVLIAVTVCLPFYVRPWLATDNPFFPYFDGWFSDDAQRGEMTAFHRSVAASFGLRTPLGLLAGPVLLAFNDLLYDGFFGWQLPAFVVLAAIGSAAAWRGGRKNGIRFGLVTAMVFYAAWFFTAQQARFVTPAVLALVAAAAAGIAELRPWSRKMALTLLMLATVVGLPWRNAGYYFSSWETLAGYWTRVENLDDGTRNTYLPLVAAVESTPADARLLLLFEHRGLYLRRPREIATPGFRAGGVPRDCETDALRFKSWLDSKQISHIVLARTPPGPDQTAEWRENVEYVYRAIELAVQENVLQVEWESPTHVLFRVTSRTARSPADLQ